MLRRLRDPRRGPNAGPERPPPAKGRRRAGRVSGVGVRDRAGETREISARLVVAADGRDSTLVRPADATSKIRPNNRFLYFTHYRNLRLASGKRSQMWLLEPDAAYTLPNDDGVTLLTCMPAREKLPSITISKAASHASSKARPKDRTQVSHVLHLAPL
ncbi:MAG TPA: hypothetical protein VHM69_12125 [Rubrobacter sp.]|nr:hypothetical protein [Rubrobacter sp.]